MRHLLQFALAAIATLSFAGCAGPLITEPAKGYALADAGGPNCRRFARPGDTKIQIYCISIGRPARDQPVASVTSNCRMLSPNHGEKVESSCRDAAQWDEYDTLAVNAGVSCRWTSWQPKEPLKEVCLTAWNWQKLADAARRVPPRARSAGGFGSPWGGSGAGSGSQSSYATSYGAFPAGGAIGQ